MNNKDWKLFERTGNIEDYLNYACTLSFTQGSAQSDWNREEDYNCDKPGNSDWYGAVSHADRRL